MLPIFPIAVNTDLAPLPPLPDGTAGLSLCVSSDPLMLGSVSRVRAGVGGVKSGGAVDERDEGCCEGDGGMYG
jgi:hypothetical protein